MKARAIIVEDEAVLRIQLEEMLLKIWPELDVVASAEDGVQGRAALERHHPDVVFLDIQMPGLSGLEVAREASGRCMWCSSPPTRNMRSPRSTPARSTMC